MPSYASWSQVHKAFEKASGLAFPLRWVMFTSNTKLLLDKRLESWQKECFHQLVLSKSPIRRVRWGQDEDREWKQAIEEGDHQISMICSFHDWRKKERERRKKSRGTLASWQTTSKQNKIQICFSCINIRRANPRHMAAVPLTHQI